MYHRIYDRPVARTDTLIQTLVPPDLATWVRARAALDGLQVSGWVRQLIHRERMRLVVEAWWQASGTERSAKGSAPYRLERLGVLAGDRVEFRWLDASDQPICDRAGDEQHALMRADLDVGRFLLRGDPRRWRVIHAFADADADGGMRLVLEPEARSAPRTRKR